MKRKLILFCCITICAALLFAMGLITVSAEGETPTACTHSGGTATCTAKRKCDICGQEYGELADHTGGTATCTAKRKCDICGQEYGELAAHDFTKESGILKSSATCTSSAKYFYACSTCGKQGENTYDYGLPDLNAHIFDTTSWCSDDNSHWYECKNEGCEAKQSDAAHSWDASWSYNNTQHYHECTVCKKQKDHSDHKYDQDEPKYHASVASQTTYFYYCICGKTGTETFQYGSSDNGSSGDSTPTTCQHNYVTKFDNNISGKHWKECTKCHNKIEEGAHEFPSSYSKDATDHWKKCTCGFEARGAHVFTNGKSCDVCGQPKSDIESPITAAPTVDTTTTAPTDTTTAPPASTTTAPADTTTAAPVDTTTASPADTTTAIPGDTAAPGDTTVPGDTAAPGETTAPVGDDKPDDDNKVEKILLILVPTLTAFIIVVVIFVLVLAKKFKSKTVPEPVGTTATVMAVAKKISLQATSGVLAGRSFVFLDGLNIGKNSALCELAMPMDTAGVGAVNCRLYFKPDSNALWLVDCGNGATYLEDGTKLETGKEYSLISGSKFCVGSTSNVFTVHF